MAQNLTFTRWVCYGEGWATSHRGSADITVTRDYGTDVATVTVVWKYTSIGGDTAEIVGHFKVGNTDHTITVASAGAHYPGDEYSKTQTFTVSVGVNEGTLSGTAWLYVNDSAATSGKSSSVLNWSQSYQSKGSSVWASVGSVTAGSTSALTITRFVSTYKHKIMYSFNQRDWGLLAENVGTSYTITAEQSNEMARKLPNSRKGTVYLRLDTYSGTTQIGGSDIKGVSYSMGSTIGLPVVSATFRMTENNPLNRYIVGMTPLGATPANSADLYGASISYEITFQGIRLTSSGSEVVFPAASVGGSLIATVTGTTSRGDTHTATYTIPYYVYEKPQISVALAFTATTITATVKWSVANVDGQNKPSKLAMSCSNGGSSNLTLSGYSGTKTWNVPGTIDTSIQTYLITAAFSDTMGNSVTQSKSTGQLVMSLYAGGKGLAFFKEATNEGIEVAGEINVEGFYKRNGEMSMANYINDVSTVNNTDTWIPVINNGRLQHTTKSNLVRTADVDTVSWENNNLLFNCFGRIVVCHLNGVTYSQLMSHTLSGKWIPLNWVAFPIYGSDDTQLVSGTVEFSTNGTIASYYYSNFDSRKTWGGSWKLYGTCVWISNE